MSPLRGNLDTRLRKLDEGQYDAIVLAAAGLKRLRHGRRAFALFLNPTTCCPLPARALWALKFAAIARTCADALAPLAHMPTWLRVTAERAVSRGMGGSCSVPLAAHATLEGDTLLSRAAWGDPEGQLPLVRAEQRAVVTTLAQADAVGLAIAQALQAAGAQSTATESPWPLCH